MRNKNELTTTQNGYVASQDFNMVTALQEEMAGLELKFDNIKIPIGGGLIFEIPTEDPDAPESVKEFSGVIIYHHPLRRYYKGAYEGKNDPPDCISFDLMTGIGDPGGTCAKCPWNQFGTALNEGVGKGCKDRRRIFIVREGEVLPLVLSLPTGSLKNLTLYIKRLLSKQKRTNMVVTNFSMKKANSVKGVLYSQVVLTVERDLTAEEQAMTAKLSEQIKAMATSVSYDEDFSDDGDYDSIPVEFEASEIVEPLK